MLLKTTMLLMHEVLLCISCAYSQGAALRKQRSERWRSFLSFVGRSGSFLAGQTHMPLDACTFKKYRFSQLNRFSKYMYM